MTPRNTLPAAVSAALLVIAPARADHIEELVVTARHDTRTIELHDDNLIAPDVARLLVRAPGAAVNSNGPLTGIPQYRGMYGSRIAAGLDGAQLAPSGPNWMDPPLSYAVSGQLESLEVYRGIAPVSVAQESIGGAIEARTMRGEFGTGDELDISGRVIGSAQSASDAFHLQGALFAANQSHRVKVAAMSESGDDAEFNGGEIIPTEYERERYDVGYGFRSGDHQVQFDYGYNDTGDAGTPALPMDIRYIRGDLYRFSYQFSGETPIALTVYGSDLDHGMTNFHLRSAPPPPNWRRNEASSDNAGFKASMEQQHERGLWRFGVDGFSESHQSDISNPNNAMFFVENFNNAEREVLGAFVERDSQWTSSLRTEFGLRYNRVAMDADEVDGTPAQMMPPAAALRDNFNAADRSQVDHNVDFVARGWYSVSDITSYYLGIARKSRSPSYQERYLWLPLEATAGLADGNTYTGNINLDPEVSHQIEAGLDFSNNRLTVSPRIFYSRIDDYIQGTESTVSPAVMFVRMMNANNGTNNADPLMFNNVDAEIYGADMDWTLSLAERWSMSGLVNYVRGERRDGSNDNLYRIAPFNTTLRLHYTTPTVSVTLENEFWAEQDNVSAAQREQETDDYALVNLHASWAAPAGVTLSAGVNNLFDSDYRNHLSGYNRAANPDVARGERLPGEGINFFARAIYAF